MAAPIRSIEREGARRQLAPSPEQRAGLLASLWLGRDGETVVVAIEDFVREVTRQIAEAEAVATRPRRNARTQPLVPRRIAARDDGRPVPLVVP